MYGALFSFFKTLAGAKARKRHSRKKEESESAVRREGASQKYPIDVCDEYYIQDVPPKPIHTLNDSKISVYLHIVHLKM